MTADLYPNPFDTEPLISNAPPPFQRATKTKPWAQSQPEPQPEPAIPANKSRWPVLRDIARTVAHPRKSRRLRKSVKSQAKAVEEMQRLRDIEEFLERGRGGPVRYH